MPLTVAEVKDMNESLLFAKGRRSMITNNCVIFLKQHEGYAYSCGELAEALNEQETVLTGLKCKKYQPAQISNTLSRTVRLRMVPGLHKKGSYYWLENNGNQDKESCCERNGEPNDRKEKKERKKYKLQKK